MSAQKMREVVRQIQGLPALHAQAVLQVVPRKGARFVAKTLKSAIANAENNKNAKIEALRIKEAVAQTATTLKRFAPKARGSAGPICPMNNLKEAVDKRPVGRSESPTKAPGPARLVRPAVQRHTNPSNQS